MNAWVIEKPELQTITQQIIYMILTALLWLFWIYLWLPLFGPWEETLGLTELIDTHMYTREQYGLLLELFVICGIASVVIATIMFAWAYYNFIPATENKRRRPSPITKVQIADHFKVDAYAIREWHKARRVHVYHDEAGWVDGVDVLDEVVPPPSATGDLKKELDIYGYVDPRNPKRIDEHDF